VQVAVLEHAAPQPRVEVGSETAREEVVTRETEVIRKVQMLHHAHRKLYDGSLFRSKARTSLPEEGLTMYGCTHPFRGATNNPQWTICECCGDSLRAGPYPVNMSDAEMDAMLEAKAKLVESMFCPQKEST